MRPSSRPWALLLHRRSDYARRAPARIRASADGGWMSEKHPLLAEEDKCFFLTSPFIEPDGRRPNVDAARPRGIEDTPCFLGAGFRFRILLPNATARIH